MSDPELPNFEAPEEEEEEEEVKITAEEMANMAVSSRPHTQVKKSLLPRVSFGHCSQWFFSPPQTWKATSQGQVIAILVVHEKTILRSTRTIFMSYFTRISLF